MRFSKLIDEYVAGSTQLREAVAGMSDRDLDKAPLADKWTTREVVCHLADFEVVYVDRMKRVLAENEPTLLGGDPDVFAARLAYHPREIAEELQLIEVLRVHMARILRAMQEEDFQRLGHHSESGPVTLEALLTGITAHIPHHIRFIEEKRRVGNM